MDSLPSENVEKAEFRENIFSSPNDISLCKRSLWENTFANRADKYELRTGNKIIELELEISQNNPKISLSIAPPHHAHQHRHLCSLRCADRFDQSKVYASLSRSEGEV